MFDHLQRANALVVVKQFLVDLGMGDLSIPSDKAFEAGMAFHSMLDLPRPWIKVGALCLAGVVRPATLLDLDGREIQMESIYRDFCDLRSAAEGHAIALSALRLADLYRHRVLEALLSPKFEHGERMRNEVLIRQIAAKPRTLLAASPGARLLGELVCVDKQLYLVDGSINCRFFVHKVFIDFISDGDVVLGRGRLMFSHHWFLEWAELGRGELVYVPKFTRKLLHC